MSGPSGRRLTTLIKGSDLGSCQLNGVDVTFDVLSEKS